jgi:hypothetical protein
MQSTSIFKEGVGKNGDADQTAQENAGPFGSRTT